MFQQLHVLQPPGQDDGIAGTVHFAVTSGNDDFIRRLCLSQPPIHGMATDTAATTAGFLVPATSIVEYTTKVEGPRQSVEHTTKLNHLV